MKKIFYFIIFIILFSCTHKEKEMPDLVKITGKVINFDSDIKSIRISVSRPGLSVLQKFARLDSMGNFSVSFEAYVPGDVWIYYRTNVLILFHPGDSINVEFDGKHYDRAKLLETIKFGGDATKSNEDASVLQKLYYSNPIYLDHKSREQAVKNYDIVKYRRYLDTYRNELNRINEDFNIKVKPNDEAKIWASLFLDSDFYNLLAKYPFNHSRMNSKRYNRENVEDEYFEPLLNQLPISKKMLISGYALRCYTSDFLFVWPSIKPDYRLLIKEKKLNINTRKFKMDSLKVHNIINTVPDDLLMQLVLTDFLRKKIELLSDFVVFEKLQDEIKSFISEPFLWEPLYQLYLEKSNYLKKPDLNSEVLLTKMENSSSKEIMEKIFETNKNKVIYLDCWSTWCGPCISELPRSKILMTKFKEKDVRFVYVCFLSDENKWKGILNELQLSGQHYFLNQQQSNEFREIFDIRGIPHYILIDKNGIIIEKGSYLRPDVVEHKIRDLL